MNYLPVCKIANFSVSSLGMQLSDLTKETVVAVLQERDEWLSPQYITTVLLRDKDAQGSRVQYVDRVQFLLEKLPGIMNSNGKYRLNPQLFLKAG
jgi:hypothetical protein